MQQQIAVAIASLPLIMMAVKAVADSAGQPSPYDTIQVTATRSGFPVTKTPASISIVTGDELRDRVAMDLRTALTALAGVEISPGGDAGPAGAVPALWGLREFDAFLLVVDGVPWGGAFNPALTTLDLHDIDRIEVMRGAAPVMYGATSFVGVIHVIHLPAGESTDRVTVSGGGVPGDPGDVAAAISQALPDIGGWRQSVTADVERRRFADQKAGLERGHALYRAGRELGGGTATVDVDVNLLRQHPTSPYPRVSDGLDPAIDTDANFHPSDARIDEDRLHVTGGYRHPVVLGEWSTTLALSRTDADVVRGYLADACGGVTGGAANACGHAQDRQVTDVYFDSHLLTPLGDRLVAVWGIDDLYGKGKQKARIFAYGVDPVHGNDAPDSSAVPLLESNDLDVERNFFGAYGQLEWNPTDTLNVLFGARLNNTHETREGVEDQPGAAVPARATRSDTKVSGSFGLAWEAWSADGRSGTLFASYRDTFKPAAVDFGPEAEADILDPETAHSTEFGVKTHWLGGTLGLNVSAFDMTMENLVVSQIVNGSPGLTNAGTLYLRGIETEMIWQPTDTATVYLAYAHHKLRFGDYERLFDSVPTQLRGNAPELAPDDTAAIGFQLAPRTGLLLSTYYSYTGERFLNKRNTSRAAAFGVLDAAVGYRFADWELSLVGRNLTNSRDPVSESELGDGQYYRMPARSISLTVSAHL